MSLSDGAAHENDPQVKAFTQIKNKTRKDIADLLVQLIGDKEVLEGDVIVNDRISGELEIHFYKTLRKLKDELQFLREAGQKEYAHGEDNAFGNFERLASMLNIDRKSILWVYCTKHLDGITSYLSGHKSQREDVRGRINDVMVYLTLLRGMIDQEEGK